MAEEEEEEEAGPGSARGVVAGGWKLDRRSASALWRGNSGGRSHGLIRVSSLALSSFTDRSDVADAASRWSEHWSEALTTDEEEEADGEVVAWRSAAAVWLGRSGGGGSHGVLRAATLSALASDRSDLDSSTPPGPDTPSTPSPSLSLSPSSPPPPAPRPPLWPASWLPADPWLDKVDMTPLARPCSRRREVRCVSRAAGHWIALQVANGLMERG